MEDTIQILIYIHAFFGGLGLITGIATIIATKGNRRHRTAGKIFSYSMVISAGISLFVARMPGHENLFLFLIGIFTIYLILAGNRALTFKPKSKAKAIGLDKLISGTMMIASIAMIIIGVMGIIQNKDRSTLYLFFGGVGLFLTYKDFHFFKTYRNEKKGYLMNHIGRMVGALIASITAFIVAGLNISAVIVWILPTILGTIYITYWVRKTKSGVTKKSLQVK